jgi:hypothetical protein
MKKTPCLVALLAATSLSSDAAVVFSEDFGTTVANPTAASFTVQNTWNYSDSAGTVVNSNESRLFNPGASGSATNSVGWISLRNGTQAFQQIQSGGTFAALPELTVGQSYQFTLTWFAGAETTNTANDMNAYVTFASAGNNLTFVSGANGTPVQGHFSSQSLSDSNVTVDTVGMNFVAQAGTGGFDPGRLYSATFTTTDALNGDAFSVALGFTTPVTSSAFVIYDNVALDVAIVPEPGAALLGSFGMLALLRRRRG